MAKKGTIGVLISGLFGDYVQNFCKGIQKAATENNLNLIIIPGKYINRFSATNRDVEFEYQYNTLFRVAADCNLDGIIIEAGSIGNFTNKENIDQFIHTFDGIPTIVASHKIDGYPSICFNNESGILEALEALYESGARSYAMFGGPESNIDAIERKETFRKFLKKHRIKYSDNMYVAGNYTSNCVKRAKQLLEQNPDVEAIFCANDEQALAMYKALESVKKEPGKDVSVLGFDDDYTAARIKPSLSSIRADAFEMGENAVKMLLESMKGVEVENFEMPTKFIMRSSFTCSNNGEYKDARNKEIEAIEHEFIESLYKRRPEEYDNSVNFKLFTQDLFFFGDADEDSYGNILDKLKYLGISNAFLYLFDYAVDPVKGSSLHLPNKILLKAMMKDGEVSMLSFARQQINTKDMFRNFYLNWRSCDTLVMHPVFSGAHLYGYLFTDLSLSDFNEAEILVNQFSSAIKMLGLLRENDEIQRQLMENLKLLRENNIVLDTFANMDMLTGLYNRRGFFTNAGELVDDCRADGTNVIAMYADMNNLKIINDKYGHEEGDYALSLVGKVIKLVVGKIGVCGRIGGDEYALVIPVKDGKTGESISELIDKKLDDANKKANKPFDVTVSCGYQVMYANLDQDLEEALAVADAMLYEVKKRKKEAMKVRGI